MRISDGTGTSSEAKVDSRNRLRVFATEVAEQTFSNALGNAYNINTGEMTLTSANESGVLYFKNNEDEAFIITAVAIGLGPSTGGASSSIPKVTITKNPTGGTVVSDASAVSINSNRNFSSQNTLTADIYKGGEGKTLTGDTDHLLAYVTANSRAFLSIDEVLPKGSSLGVTITPQASNTSMTCYVALIGYLDEGLL